MFGCKLRIEAPPHVTRRSPNNWLNVCQDYLKFSGEDVMVEQRFSVEKIWIVGRGVCLYVPVLADSKWQRASTTMSLFALQTIPCTLIRSPFLNFATSGGSVQTRDRTA